MDHLNAKVRQDSINSLLVMIAELIQTSLRHTIYETNGYGDSNNERSLELK